MDATRGPEPTEADLRPSGSFAMAASLAAVAGFVDAHLFLHVGQVFVANMSGNVVLLGMAAGRRDGLGVIGPTIAIVGFVAGMAIATALHIHFYRAGRTLRPDLVVLIELIAFAGLIAFAVGVPNTTAAAATPRAYPLLAAGGLAMGLQTAVIRRVGNISVITTYETGTVARLGEESVLARTSAPPGTERPARSRVLWVLSALVVAYAGGATAASALGESPLLLLVPATALVLVAGVLSRQRSPVG